MALPKRRHSSTRRDKRRTHWKMKNPAVSRCPHCNHTKLPHRVCPNCGHYGGEEVVAEKSKG